MHKILIASLVTLVALSANFASAQTYYPPTQPFYPSYLGTSYSGACVNLYSDLSFGSHGSEVSQLQTFLVSQNFPGSGNWMITGNFRSATLAAVRNFQQAQGLSISGIVDAATRAAISRASCGGSSYGYNYGYNNSYPYTNPFSYNNTNTNCYYTYPYTCNNTYYNNYYNTVTLSSLSVITGLPGTSVTIYGSGFDYSNNTIYFGSTPFTNVSSSNGTSLTFTVPSYVTAGTVGVYVTNSRGTSNTLNFGVLATYTSCPSIPGYPYTYGYGNYGTYGSTYCPPNSGVTSLTYVNPTSGAVGSTVTVVGTGFSPTGNTVHFGSGIITGLNSTDGRTLLFTVPSQLLGGSSSVVTPGVYNVYVTNFSNQTSNTLPYTVSATGAWGIPTIVSVNGPTSLATGVQSTWTIQVNNPTNSYMTTSVNWGDSGQSSLNTSAPQTTYAEGVTTLTFTHAYYTLGTYAIVFTVGNGSGQVNTSSVTVYVGNSGSYSNLTLSSISPMSGPVGSQIMLVGTGFTPLENTVHFGIGGIQHVPSQNGTTIYYTIPSFVSPCDLATPGALCAQNAQPVMPGPIQVYVQNNLGTSNTILFQVSN